MELRHIKYLLAVADHQNFTRAAEALHISQPTLSQQIKQLEHAVGVKLFDRSGRTVRLTDAGSAYVHHARLAVRDLEAAERAVHDVRDLSRGNLRIAVTPTFTAYLIGQLIYSYREAYPGIRVTVLETNQDKMEADLLADRLDLGIGFAGPHAAGIEARTLFAETLVLVVGSGHPLETGAVRVPVAELAGEPLGLLSSDFATRLHVDAYFAECQVPQNIAIEANSVSALLELVGRGVVATVLPDAITSERPDLHPVPLDPPLPTRTVQVLQRAGVYQSAAARAFAAMLDAMVAERRS
ncbi:transcription regulator LysR family protein [Mycolicibacter terrae]|jgi:LysR family cyn operon transcriptional activator|uniref:Probable hydrogen peroxide-inducible genes activator n=1 Tax=Mycolicibacter terrae TaxID=1788 RepID=A0AAD1HTZ3_9MYCO|nr:transcriptional regulator CynR [Mycolicibacter terrae]ORW95084.1 transcriptional regulator [Mycolicibacter terrae]BBX20631.1 transcription regulator LysR family protein [Mycolicibacter terrae]SNV94646.1 hydrogen peroxide-inducible genes activator OxyR [Mycolicibacter terrae]